MSVTMQQKMRTMDEWWRFVIKCPIYKSSLLKWSNQQNELFVSIKATKCYEWKTIDRKMKNAKKWGMRRDQDQQNNQTKKGSPNKTVKCWVSDSVWKRCAISRMMDRVESDGIRSNDLIALILNQIWRHVPRGWSGWKQTHKWPESKLRWHPTSTRQALKQRCFHEAVIKNKTFLIIKITNPANPIDRLV